MSGQGRQLVARGGNGGNAGRALLGEGGDTLAEVGAAGRLLHQAEGLVLRLVDPASPVGRDLGLDRLHREG